MDTDYFLDSIQWIFVVLESLSLFVFAYYIKQYCANTKSLTNHNNNPHTSQNTIESQTNKQGPRDTYTISCFVFILLTILSRVALKLVMLIIKQIRIDFRNTHKGKDPEWYLDNISSIQCESRLSSYLPTGFFTVAILINSMRWLHLIRINK